MAIQTFTQDFLKSYNISSFFQNEKRGGQKMVYFPVQDGQKCVLKIFPYGQDARFNREMEIYKKFKSLDGIPKIIQQDIYRGNTIVFEEYIEGDTLSDISLNYQEDDLKVNALIKDIFEILIPVWRERYVHRDIKPENIIIRDNGKPVVIDFGIARDLDANSITGTGFQPHSWLFSSPEQYGGKRDLISYRTDFFSLGILAYYLFHQKHPFGNTYTDIETKFNNKQEDFICNLNFSLSNFCSEVLKFSPSERPRHIEDTFKLLN